MSRKAVRAYGEVRIFRREPGYTPSMPSACPLLPRAAGRITAPPLLDAHGDFDLPGLYIRTGPGPVPANDSLTPRFPVRYTGHTDGRTMTFTVSGDSVPAQSFDMTYGGNPNVMKCV